MIHIKVEFNNLATLPSEEEVLKIANAALDSETRKELDLGLEELNNAILQNIIYESKFLS